MSASIEILWAKKHNLKNVSISIPKNKLTVITGVSGSGKSSLAFDTLYAEGQKRYLESLSTYARMIIAWGHEETMVDEIRGLSPTISINQKTVSSNPRSTVGTITEIYDFYRLLFLHIGVQQCPTHGTPLQKNTIGEVFERVKNIPTGERFLICAPLHFSKGKKNTTIQDIKQQVLSLGFIRYMIGTEIFALADTVEKKINPEEEIYVVIDRLVSDGTQDENTNKRIKDSLELAYKTGDEFLLLYFPDSKKQELFSRQAVCLKCHYRSQDLTLSHFSFNSHFWACERCHGLGVEVAFLEENIINENLSIAEWAILPWNQGGYYLDILATVAKKYNIDIQVPYKKLSGSAREIILHGVTESFEIDYMFDNGNTKKFKTRYEWIIPFLERKYRESDTNDTFTKRIAQYMTEIECPVCNGYRLKEAPLNVLLSDVNIGQVADYSVKEAIQFFASLDLSNKQSIVAKNILTNIRERLQFLSDVGLDYITISRRANTLSGGEAQRIRLATQIGTRLEGIIYVLDEPSIGLHARDNGRLIKNLKALSEIWNTVVVVEHDEDIMHEADYIIDIWPGAWVHGGEIVFSGTYDEIIRDTVSETGQFLANKKRVLLPQKRGKPKKFVSITGASENNLKNVSVEIPLEQLAVVTGVSGSGKSSLIMDILAPYLLNKLNRANQKVGRFGKITGIEHLDKAIIVDQSPIGKTPHSNIATYTGLFTPIREVFAASQEALRRGYDVGRFSFNTRGWRCDVCEGSGVKKVEMHFLPDVYVECESCHGTRYNNETLEVKFKGKNISEVLEMTVEEALEFFKNFPRIRRFLEVLFQVGLGYVRIGQAAPTLSGWEAQRIKLATELAKRSTSKTMYILDEPTTGLHFSDIQKLLNILDGLVEKGNSVLVIEHNLDFVACADWIIDIWPEWGSGGGSLLFSGPREGILDVKGSHTAEALKEFLKKKWK